MPGVVTEHRPFARYAASLIVFPIAGAALLSGCELAAPRSPEAANAPLAAGGCPAQAVCFNVVPGAAGPLAATRVVLFWTPPNESKPPEIFSLATLSGGERSLVLPRSALPVPRTSIDSGQAWGYVFVVPATETGPPNPKSAVGVARMMFVHAVGASWQAPLMAEKFPAGIAEDTAGYTMQRGRMFDNFVLAPQGTVFDLVICPPAQQSCDLPFPNPK